MAKAMHQEIPTKLTLLVFGDVSQSWLEADLSWREIVIAGRDRSPILGCRADLPLWNAQINYFVSLIALCVSGFNAWIFVIGNLLPMFPMDGGRFIRALLQGLMKSPTTSRWIRYFGSVIALAVNDWGISCSLNTLASAQRRD